MVQVIVLNGGSSSGKTGLARCLQAILPEPWIRLSVDDLVDALPPSLLDSNSGISFGQHGEIAVSGGFREVEAAWMAGVAAMARAGARVIFDDVFLSGAASQERTRIGLAGLKVMWVGVHCDPVIAAGREIARGDRATGMAASQADAVHKDVVYDIEVDTSHTQSLDCARLIAAQLSLAAATTTLAACDSVAARPWNGISDRPSPSAIAIGSAVKPRRGYADVVTGTHKTPPRLDITTPNVARMYDYYLGGKDNFAADREAAEKVLALVPGLRRAVQENRRFLRRVVRFLAAEAGVTQFLDIGVGLPTQGAVHEVAREVGPGVRVAYVDYDPVVVAHGQALLAVSDLSVMVRADVRRPAELLAHPDVRAHLDLTKPVAITLFATLHFLPDADDPAGIVGCLRDAVASGSYLAVSHIGTEFFPDKKALARAVQVYEKASERMWPRSREQILGFFDGFELLEPGMVPKHQWRPVTGEAAADTPNIQWGAVGRKP